MTVKRDAYRFKDGVTDLSADTFNQIFADLDARLHSLEHLGVTWKDAVFELQRFGLERINGALAPILEGMVASVNTLKDEHTSFVEWWGAVKVDVLDIHAASVAMQAALVEIRAKEEEITARVEVIASKQPPVGTIIPYMGGYFSDSGNTGFTSVWGNDAASLNARFNEDGWYVCDGAMLNLPGSPFFDGPNRYLPNLTDDRFIMGSTGAGALGGDNTMEHSHGMEHTHNTANFTLSNAEIPNHNHTEHPALWAQIAGTNFVASATAANNQSNTKATGRNDLLTSGTGGGDAHNHGATSAASTDTTDEANYTENRPRFLSCIYLMRVI